MSETGWLGSRTASAFGEGPELERQLTETKGQGCERGEGSRNLAVGQLGGESVNKGGAALRPVPWPVQLRPGNCLLGVVLRKSLQAAWSAGQVACRGKGDALLLSLWRRSELCEPAQRCGEDRRWWVMAVRVT